MSEVAGGTLAASIWAALSAPMNIDCRPMKLAPFFAGDFLPPIVGE
jgi:hypothetical protein